MKTQQEIITAALDGAGFTKEWEQHRPAVTTWGGKTTSAERHDERWVSGHLGISVSYDKRGQLARYTYSGDTSGVNRNGGAQVNLRRTKRNHLITTHAQLTELFLRNLDEMVTGCLYMAQVTDGVVTWVREEATA